MKVKCSKCNNILKIADDKLPKNKKKASVQCTKCKHSIVFTIPNAAEPEGEKTILNDGDSLENIAALKVKLVDVKTAKEYFLRIGKNVLGRKADISIADDKYISRLHCLIEVKKQTWGLEIVISDDGFQTGKPSTNGTFYKGERLSKYDKIILQNGERIRVGRTELLITFYK